MVISCLIFTIFSYILTTYWILKLVDQELKLIGTAGFKGLGKGIYIYVVMNTMFIYICIYSYVYVYIYIFIYIYIYFT